MAAIFGRERRRELNKDDLQFGCEWLDRLQETSHFGGAIAQTADVSDLAWQFTGETKSGRCYLEPTPQSVFRRRAVESAIDFDGRKITGIELEPVRVWQIRRIKISPPFVECPGASADTDFLLIDQIQGQAKLIEIAQWGKMSIQTMWILHL